MTNKERLAVVKLMASARRVLRWTRVSRGGAKRMRGVWLKQRSFSPVDHVAMWDDMSSAVNGVARLVDRR